MNVRRCPDNVVCNSSCDVGCWRAGNSRPWPGAYEGNEWPESVRDLPPALPPALTGAPVPEVPTNAALYGKLRACRDRAEGKGGKGFVQLLLRPEEAIALANVLAPPLPTPDRLRR